MLKLKTTKLRNVKNLSSRKYKTYFQLEVNPKHKSCKIFSIIQSKNYDAINCVWYSKNKNIYILEVTN